MNNKQLETWAWVLIYAGLILITLGLFLLRGAPGSVWGLVLLVLGAGLVSVGIVFVVLRSRRAHDR